MGYKSQNSFDGIAVDVFEGRFSGAFEIDDEAAKDIGCDDVVYILMAATVTKATLNLLKDDTLKRTNTFKVSGARVLTVEESQKVLSSVGSQGLYPGVDIAAVEFDDTSYEQGSLETDEGDYSE